MMFDVSGECQECGEEFSIPLYDVVFYDQREYGNTFRVIEVQCPHCRHIHRE